MSFAQQVERLKEEYDAKFAFVRTNIRAMTPEEKDLARLDLEHLADRIQDAEHAALLERGDA